MPRTLLRGSSIAHLFAASVALGAVACGARQAGSPISDAGEPRRASLLPDVSGLAWIGGDRFLAVHDAKFPDEPNRPRVSLLTMPTDLDGIRWTPLAIEFPGNPASDLESAARVPDAGGRARFLISESTEEVAEKPFSRRIFLLEMRGEEVAVIDHIEWPIPTRNVEGMAVGGSDGSLVFLFAERAHGEPSTDILWAELTLEPLRLGPFRRAGAFESPGPTGPNGRPVSALEVDGRGIVYAASAEDPDDDDGPFRSAVYRIGRVVTVAGRAAVELDRRPSLLGTLDGFKAEGLAARERPGGGVELWIGVDDEHYGGTLRPLPGSARASRDRE